MERKARYGIKFLSLAPGMERRGGGEERGVGKSPGGERKREWKVRLVFLGEEEVGAWKFFTHLNPPPPFHSGNRGAVQEL